jgi:predicted enzyme involved in methoxymalonyl-ACP biosynthesis
VTAEVLADELAIRDWLMSCRVLARGVEGFLMNRVVEHAQQLGLSRVTAEFIPTAKNSMVKDFFRQFGFTKVEEGAKGDSRWSLSTKDYLPWRTFMQVAEGNVAANH